MKFFNRKKNLQEKKGLLNSTILENFYTIINDPNNLTNGLVRLLGNHYFEDIGKSNNCLNIAFYNSEKKVAFEMCGFNENSAYERWLRLCDFFPYLSSKRKLSQTLVTLFEWAFGHEFSIHFAMYPSELSAKKIEQRLRCIVTDYYFTKLRFTA